MDESAKEKFFAMNDPVPLTYRRRGWEALAQATAVQGRVLLSLAIQSALAERLFEDPLTLFMSSDDAFEVTAMGQDIALAHGRVGRSTAPTAVHETVPGEKDGE